MMMMIMMIGTMMTTEQTMMMLVMINDGDEWWWYSCHHHFFNHHHYHHHLCYDIILSLFLPRWFFPHLIRSLSWLKDHREGELTWKISKAYMNYKWQLSLRSSFKTTDNWIIKTAIQSSVISHYPSIYPSSTLIPLSVSSCISVCSLGYFFCGSFNPRESSVESRWASSPYLFNQNHDDRWFDDDRWSCHLMSCVIFLPVSGHILLDLLQRVCRVSLPCSITSCINCRRCHSDRCHRRLYVSVSPASVINSAGGISAYHSDRPIKNTGIP